MVEVTYRVMPNGLGFKVEVNRPGEMIQTAIGFRSEADAQSWIAEDKRIAEINDRQKPIQPPHLREA
jgi:hypothetical protein